jgi:hypothetical protein
MGDEGLGQKSRRRLLGGGAAAVVGAGLATVAGGAAQAQPASGIIGVWRIDLPASIRRPFITQMWVFHADGTVVGFDGPIEGRLGAIGLPDDVVYSAPYAGSWRGVPGPAVDLAVYQYNYDRLSNWISQEKMTGTLRLNATATELTGSLLWMLMDREGEVQVTNPLNVQGQRLAGPA